MGFPVQVSRSYNSQDKFSGPLGYGWVFNYGIKLYSTSDSTNHYAVIRMPNGQRYKFKDLGGGSFQPPISIWDSLKRNPDGTYTLKMKGGEQTFHFSAEGNLTSIEDESGNALNFTYDSYNQLERVDNGLGRYIDFSFYPNGKISQIQDNLGRVLVITLPRPDAGFPEDFIITYTYDNFEVVDGKELVYTTQEDPNGRVTRYYYDQFDQLVRVLDAKGKVTEFEYDKGRLLTIQDANLNNTTYGYDYMGRLATVDHPVGGTTTYTYYDDSLLKTKTDRKAQTITYLYDKLKRLKEKRYPDGKKILYTYTGGMMGSIEDQVAVETTSFTYDSSYRVQSISNPRGIFSYTHTAAGQVQTYQVAYTLTN